MKLKKILSVILSAAIAINCAFVMCFNSGAVNASKFVYGDDASGTVFGEYVYQMAQNMKSLNYIAVLE